MPSRSSSLSRKLNLKRVALDGLIERELLVGEAKRLGIAVTDAEVTDQLYAGYVRVSVPAADPTVSQSIVSEMYQSYAHAGLVSPEIAQAHFNERDTAIPVDFRDPKTKVFDMKTYDRKVRNLSNRSTAEFREEQARELLASKMRDLVRNPIRISDAEAWQEYARRFSTATVGWVSVKESWAARWAVDARPSEVDAWATGHQSDVDKAVDDRGKDDAPKAGHVRHILVKLPYGATDEERALAVAKLSWAASRVRAGESFAEVARQVSDDAGSAMKGGDVGDKTDGFVAPFKAAADALKPGEVTAGAVQTQFGYHFIMRDDPAKAAEIDAQVKRDVARDLFVKSKATEAAQGVARKIGDAMRTGRSAEQAIDDATRSFVHDAKSAPLKPIPDRSPSASESDPHADASAGSPSAGAAEKADVLPERIFDAIADADGPHVQTSSAFNAGGDPFPGLSPEGTTGVVGFAFSSKDGDVLAEPVRTADGFVVVTLKQHKIATREDFEKDRETFQEELLRAKRDEALSLYVKRLRDQAKGDLKVDETYVQEPRVDGGASAPAEDEDEY
jgi:peptidyl-prolyl cis-trans isomerase D